MSETTEEYIEIVGLDDVQRRNLFDSLLLCIGNDAIVAAIRGLEAEDRDEIVKMLTGAAA